MMNRTVLAVAVVVIIGVVVGTAQIISGRSGGTEAAGDMFPAAAPYVEPTPTPALPAADVPGEDIDGLPRYPESVRVAYDNRSSDAETTISIDYVTGDTLEPVHDHVLNIVSSFGWTLTHEEFVAGSRSFALAREGELAEILLHQRGGLVVMSIDYTRQDVVVESEPAAEPVVQPAQDPVPPPPPQQSEPPPPQPEAPPSEPAEQDDQVEHDESDNPAPETEHKPEKEKNEEKEKKDKQDKEEREKKEKKEKDEKQDRPVENNGNRDDKKDKKKDRD